MNRLQLTALALGATTALPVCHAAQAPAQGWTGKGQVGYVMSTGNTDASTANAQLDMADTSGAWKDALHLEALYAKSAGVVSNERWAGLFQSNYQLTQPLFVFGELHYTHDEFSGFSYQGSATAGAGYNFLASATNKLSAQLGAGYRALRPETLVKNAAGDVVYRVPGASNSNAIVTATIAFEHDFNAATKLTEKALVESGAADTLLENDLALQVQMSRRLALSVGYSIHDNSSPPVGVQKVDTLTTLNLVFQVL